MKRNPWADRTRIRVAPPDTRGRPMITAIPPGNPGGKAPKPGRIPGSRRLFAVDGLERNGRRSDNDRLRGGCRAAVGVGVGAGGGEKRTNETLETNE